MATATQALSVGTLIKSLTAPDDGYLIAQLNGTGMDGIVDVEFQQSMDNENWETIKDPLEDPIRYRLTGSKAAFDTKIGVMEPFYALYLRAKITSQSTTGQIEIITNL